MVSDIETHAEVQIIPIAAITVENPRERSEKTFRALVDSIGKVGLKKPITVAQDETASGDAYRLVCGQGRMEAYVALGETHIPAIVVDANEVERLLRSVIENIARRQQRPLELLQDIAILRDRGYSDHDIAEKTGLSWSYVHEIGELIANGEERLLIAVETGQMPLSVALYITRAEEKDVQKALEAAYASGELRGKKLLEARRLVELRHRHGKKKGATRTKRSGVRMTSAALACGALSCERGAPSPNRRSRNSATVACRSSGCMAMACITAVSTRSLTAGLSSRMGCSADGLRKRCLASAGA